MVGPTTTTRSSNPRLMAEVLEAVKDLGEGRGSSAKEVLEILRRGKTVRTRNLAMQVQRALKNAVNAGLLQLRAGRYKILFSLKRRKNNRENESFKPVEKNDRKKEEIANLQHRNSVPFEPRDAGPKNRCSHCKKQKRRRSRSSSKRRRKSGSKRRRRPMKHGSRAMKDRKSRKLQRRGDEEDPPRGGRSRRRKISGSDVPERTGNSVNPDRNDEEEEAGETDAFDNRSRSSSPAKTEGKTMTRGMKRRPGPAGAPWLKKARKKVRRVSKTKRRRKSRKRRRSLSRISSTVQDGGSSSNFHHERDNLKDIRMEFCDEERRRDQEINRDDANDACDRDSVASA